MSSSNLIKGNVVAEAILKDVMQQVNILIKSSKRDHLDADECQQRCEQKTDNTLLRPPHLAVIIVGNRKDSLTYVRRKIETCKLVAIKSSEYVLPSSTTQDELLNLIKKLNAETDIDGILVQLPLPEHIEERTIIHAIDPAKDVDGLHPYNIGCLASAVPDALTDNRKIEYNLAAMEQLKEEIKKNQLNFSHQYFCPCTAEGIVELLLYNNVPIEGARVTVVGRSSLVGLPVSLLLLKRNATVTMCHSKTVDLRQKCQEADILIVAIGRPKFIKADWIKRGAVVIDVGINAVNDPKTERGYRLCGDVDSDDVQEKCRITPVPGGVGPVTVAILMRNTLKARLRRIIE